MKLSFTFFDQTNQPINLSNRYPYMTAFSLHSDNSFLPVSYLPSQCSNVRPVVTPILIGSSSKKFDNAELLFVLRTVVYDPMIVPVAITANLRLARTDSSMATKMATLVEL